MVIASPEYSPFSGTLSFPGKKKPEGFVVAPMSTRALEISKNREELIGLLRDVPESDYELSLTDLVEKGGSTGDNSGPDEKTRGEGDLNQTAVMKERKRNSRRSFSSGDGVLLNIYMPTSFTRNLTTSRPSSQASTHGVKTDCSKRERDRDQAAFGCWSAIWEKGWRGKSRRQRLRDHDECPCSCEAS